MHRLCFTPNSPLPKSMVALPLIVCSVEYSRRYSSVSSLSFLPAGSCSEFTVSEVVLLLKSTVAQHPALHCRGKKESRALLYSTAGNRLPCVHCPSFFHTSCFEPVLEGGHVAVFQQVLSLLHTALCAFGGWIPVGLAADVSPFCTISFDVLVTLKMLQSSSKSRRPWGHISRGNITPSSYKIPLQRKVF